MEDNKIVGGKEMSEWLFFMFILLFWHYSHTIKEALYAIRNEVKKNE